MATPYILILFYSQYGSTAKLANYIARGVESVEGIEARIRTVPPVSPTCEISSAMVPEHGAPYVSLDDLKNAKGLALGSPTRFGNIAAPLKYFIDSTSALWLAGDLINKPACVFTSTSSMHGGQETTLTSMMLPLLHHGMVIVGVPYSEPSLTATQTGGTPYGVSHVGGANNDNVISDDEITLAKCMGQRISTLALKISG